MCATYRRGSVRRNGVLNLLGVNAAGIPWGLTAKHEVESENPLRLERGKVSFPEEAGAMRVRLQVLSLVVVVAVLCLGMVVPAWTQSTNTGNVAGTVTDSSGAVLPGVNVTLSQMGTSSTRSAVTNDAGKYFFANVDPGQYSISLSKQGFSTTKSQAEVKVGQSTTFNLAMQVGAATTTVEVEATGTELQTMNATVGNTLDSVAIDNLPSMGRDAATFLALQPGVSPDGSVGGAVVDQTQFTLDGGNNTNDMDGSMSVYTTSYASDPTGGIANQSGGVAAGPTGVMPTPLDSIEEFKVNTTGQTADFNGSAGAEVKMVTKRGTDAYHGTAYEYYRDNNWSSNSWENNMAPAGVDGHGGLPTFHYNRFGGAVGGPLIPKDVLGGKTYFFFNYEGFRYPNSRAINRNVPSPNLRNGILTDPKTGLTYDLKANDPRGIGLNPLVQQLWSKYEPQSNFGCVNSLCDGVNILGFHGNVALPQSSKFSVVRVDHDFSSKWHFMSSWRYYNLKNPTTDQIDIGGFFKGDTLGTPASVSSDPQQAWYLVAGLTTNITSNTTNDIHYSFLRNWWAWNRAGDTIQLPGINGALELGSGESATQNLAPYNVNAQQTRTRFWDGHDQMFRDDLSMLKGNHLFQFGGTYEHNWDYHQRTDNGGGINYQPVYQLGQGGKGAGAVTVGFCAGVSSDFKVPCGADYAAALGIVSASQTAFTRSGPQLTLNPPLTPAFDQSTIPFYNVYFSDTWHMKPTFTLTYGLGYTLEMPPVEAQGKQVALVGPDDQIINGADFLAARQRQALLGQVFNPIVGFALTHNAGNSPKYPYNPYYGSFSPRVAVAWNPHFDADSAMGKVFGSQDTVVRGGYGRVFGRLNGVNLVLVPLLGTGLIQPVQCFNNLASGTCGASGSATDSTAFRVGIDGPTAPLPTPSSTLVQPDYPGVNAIGAGAGEVLDPNFRPNVIDSFDFTIQRQLSRKYTLELGYIGRRITHEYMPVNLNAVPYMMTAGGQQFKTAYANTVLQYCGGLAGLGGGGCAANRGAVTPQAFFETALAGTGYCTTAVNTGTKAAPIMVTPTSCTDAVVLNEGVEGQLTTGNLANSAVWSLWSDLDSGGFNFPRTMQNTAVPGSSFGGSGQLSSGVADNMSIGYGNYNALFATLKMTDWKGLTLQSNFTWSKALGTDAVVQASSELTPNDPFNLAQNYGVQAFDRRMVYTMFMVYSPPFFKGQHGLVGRALGGWTIASTFSAGSGQPVEIGTTNGTAQAFGAGDGSAYFDQENAVPMGHIQSGHVYNTPGSNGVGTGGLPANIFKDPAAAYASYRNPILGIDTRDGGFGVLTGLRYWNVDMSVKKNIRVAESVSMELQGVFANVFNHNQLLDPVGLALGSPGSFGNVLGSAQPPPVGGNRQIELGARVRF